MRTALLLPFGALVALAASGCDTNAFCFDDCPGGSTETNGTNTGAGGAGGAGSSSGVTVGPQSSGITVGQQSTATGAGGCEVTSPEELCDGLDNDCNGEVDDDIDFTDPRQCGNCETNCFTLLLNNDPETIGCTPPENAGEAGTCTGECTADYYDNDGDGSCEFYCVRSADDDVTCDEKDDDCDGTQDEDVDLCTDNQNCGFCGHQCEAPNATTECVADEDAQTCNAANTQCEILACAPGWVDVNGAYTDGCEIPCEVTNGGVEICGDQLDNDCDGAIDGADSDLSGDPFFGDDCYGGQTPGGDPPEGICGAEGAEGTWACSGAGYACVGPNVVEPGQIAETCNGDDDDCDGLIDNNATDVGVSCGTSNIAPCTFGTTQCIDGVPECVGAIEPGTEVCNGRDDDCDGTPDDDPTDVGTPCSVPPPPPSGATSPCQAGVLVCDDGAIDCFGDILAQGTADTCGVDQNCDGVLTGQPDTDSDVRNCGACDNDCYDGQPAGTLWACDDGDCAFQGCAPGYIDLPGGAQCEYQCTPTGPEVCNNLDDDCDNQVDEGVTAPPPTQVCGVSPSATRPECTTGVSVACTGGQFVCTFSTPGVCTGGCSANDEVCENTGLDNDCDGLVNENVANWGQDCASDDDDPDPGDGACRTTGEIVCTSATTVACNAVPESCADLPGGCTELCDGIDNDCDGSIDEVRATPGANTAFYYRPETVRVGTSLASSVWMYAHEASRPDATATSAGSGNGYVTSAPTGTTLDATPACSEPGRLPWFNVTPAEVEQTCTMMGGQICEYTTMWRPACRVQPRTPDCVWGYNPSNGGAGGPCTVPFTASKYCNIAPAFDFDTMTAGDQDGLLPTGDLSAENCFADWAGLLSNPATDDQVFDITGNLREIVVDTSTNPDVFRVVGGAFNTQAESGATCDFSFYSVGDAEGADRNATFKYFDTGFRCCFAQDPDP